jgi:hypothetical protein
MIYKKKHCSAKDNEAFMKKLKKEGVNFEKRSGISDELHELMCRMFQPNPKKRYFNSIY